MNSPINKAKEQEPPLYQSSRFPFWHNANSSPIKYWLHLPNDKQIFDTGIIICNPLGFEYTHSYRSLRYLADTFSTAGYPTIRFDYIGTGDSFNDSFQENCIDEFINNIKQLITRIKQETGVTKITLIGLRLGATLAAKCTEDNFVDNLILWNPCVKGARYVREQQALEKMASHQATKEKDFIDSGGFVLTNQTADSLKKINLLKQSYQANNILIVHRNDLEVDSKLFDYLSNERVFNVNSKELPGYADMMAEPQDTIIPLEAINEILSWHLSLEQSSKKQYSFAQTKKLTANIENSDLVEELIYTPKRKLFGILSYKKNTSSEFHAKALIVLTNSGSVHHVGPNQVYVELARKLAENGHPVLRIDLRNLGDSVIAIPEDENSPYPINATEDIAAFLRVAKRQFGFNSFVVSGLCSGAHNSFHFGLEEPSEKIKEVILINPLAFYRKQNINQSTSNISIEKDTQQYKKSFLSPKKWVKLLKGKVDYIYVFKFIVKSVRRKLKSIARSFLESIGAIDGNMLSRDFLRYSANQIKLTFFIASKDPGKRIIMSEAGKVVQRMKKADELNIYDIPNADHTFSTHECRQEFIQRYLDYINKHYS